LWKHAPMVYCGCQWLLLDSAAYLVLAAVAIAKYIIGVLKQK